MHFALAEARSARPGPHRIGRLAGEQRLVARDQVRREEALCEMRCERVGRELQLTSLALRPKPSPSPAERRGQGNYYY